MNFKTEFQKFVTGQYVYSGVRITIASVIPALILAYFGVLKEYFMFPLATTFVGLTDLPGPFIRRRNSFLLAVVCFFVVALVSGLVRDYPILVSIEIILFGIFFTMVGVYGQRIASVGAWAFVVMAIFIEPNLTGDSLAKALLVFLSGSLWFVVVFLIVSKLQPYKLASQMIGENYLELSDFLRLKSKYYYNNPNFNRLNHKIISKQIVIKNLQEETRETVLLTRTFVNEATTASRLLMMMFLNSFELHEKLMTSENDYENIHKNFGATGYLPKIGDYLSILSREVAQIGISLQSGNKVQPLYNLDEKYQKLYEEYRIIKEKNTKNIESFAVLEQILVRISELTTEIKNIYNVFSQDVRLAESLSLGIDYNKFVPKVERFNLKILKNNFSLNSQLFRHSIRLTLALLLGYWISFVDFLGIGHPYWIFITIVAILRPSYSITKSRNVLRLYGTILGAVVAYLLLYFVENSSILLGILFISMILCFAFIRGKYMTAVFFMTMYVFLIFNFINPGNVNVIFKDRIVDTLIGGGICFLVSYLVLPVWEHTQNIGLMNQSVLANEKYFNQIIIETSKTDYKLARKDAIISLANLSDNFQRMVSDPKNRRDRLEIIHQFVTTSHLITAYMASLSQMMKTKQAEEQYLLIWKEKINFEFGNILSLFQNEKMIIPNNLSIDDNPKCENISIKNESIQSLLNLIYTTLKEQRKIVEKYYLE